MRHQLTRLFARLLLIVGVLAAFTASAQAALTVTNNGSSVGVFQGTTYNNAPYFAWTGAQGPVVWTVTVTGGPGATSFNGGGLVFNSNGTLSGLTCQKNGNFNYNYSVTDGVTTVTGSAANQVNKSPGGACQAGVLTLTSAPPTGQTVGGSYNQTNTAGGGTPGPGGYTYTINGGTLPPGTTFDPKTGVVSGTPTATGTGSYTIFATDSLGNTSPVNRVDWTIAAGGTTPQTPALSLTASQPTISVGGTSQLQPSGGAGTGATTYTLVSGPCTVDANTGLVTATGAGTCRFTATKAGDGTYAPSTSNFVDITVNAGPQAPLNLTASTTSIGVGQTSQLSTTGGSGTGAVTYAQVGGTGTCTVDPSTGLVTATVAGTCIFEATKAGDTNYNSATSNQVTVNVTAGSTPVNPAITLSPSTSTITTAQTATLTVGGVPLGNQAAPYNVAAQGPITYSVSGPCSVSPTSSPVGASITTVVTPTGTGTCTVTATMPADSNYLSSTSNTATITVTGPSGLTLGPDTIPAATQGVPYTQVFTASGGTPGYTYSIDQAPPGMTFDPATGTLSGVPSTPGTYAFEICATDSGTPTPQRICKPYSLTVGGGIGITTSSIPAPTLGAPYNQPVVVAGAVGAVTYAITAGALPAGLTLNRTTGVISGNTQASGCYNFTVTATDSGRVAPYNTTSKAYSFCVARPDPSQDANVRGIISSQARAAYRFVRGQIALIQSHLDHLHDDDDSGDGCSDPDRPGAVRDLCIEYDNKVQIRGAQRTLSGQEQDVQNLRRLNDVNALADPTGVATQNRDAQRLTQNEIEKQSKVASVDPMINTTNNTQDSHLGAADPNMRNFSALAIERSSNYPARTAGQAPEIVGPTPRIKGGVKVNVWTAGEVDFGRYDNQGRLLNEKFNVGSLAVGADMRVMPGLRAGVAFGYGNDYATINYGLARSEAQNFSATGYASYKIAPGIFVDGLFGYGDLHYFSNRLGGDNSWISGNRNGYALFQSLALTVEKRYGGLKIAPYVRVDGGQVYLNSYTEMGSREWALSYNGANTNTVDAVGGVRASYDYKLNSGGVITPNVRAQFQKFFTSSVSQWMNYAIDPSMSYNYFDMGQLQWLFMGTIGAQYTLDNVSAGVDFVTTTSGARYQTNGVRANIRVSF